MRTSCIRDRYRYDVEYAHCIEELEALMAPKYPLLVWSRLAVPEPTEGKGWKSSNTCTPMSVATNMTGGGDGGCCGGSGAGSAQGGESGYCGDSNDLGAALTVPTLATSNSDGCGSNGCSPGPGGPTAAAAAAAHGVFDGEDVIDDASAGTTPAAFGRTFELADGLSMADYAMLYVGPESQTLTNLMLCVICSLFPFLVPPRHPPLFPLFFSTSSWRGGGREGG